MPSAERTVLCPPAGKAEPRLSSLPRYKTMCQFILTPFTPSTKAHRRFHSFVTQYYLEVKNAAQLKKQHWLVKQNKHTPTLCPVHDDYCFGPCFFPVCVVTAHAAHFGLRVQPQDLTQNMQHLPTLSDHNPCVWI